MGPTNGNAMSTASPVPQAEIKTSLAPGKRGPVGIAPRTDYSRPNTGFVPSPDAGATEQKSTAPRGVEMLPKTAASEDFMGQVAMRPTINEMVKQAMAGAVKASDITREATRQASNLGEATKTASAAPPPAAAVTDLEQAEKLASALDYVASLVKQGESFGNSNNTGPGKGPGTLAVTESHREENPIKPNNQGHGHHGQIPKNPPLERSHPGGPKNHLATNADNPAGFHTHNQPTSMVNQKHASVAQGIRAAWNKVAGSEEHEKEDHGDVSPKKKLETDAARDSEKDASDKERDPKKLTKGQAIGSALLGGPGGYFGARKAKEHGHGVVGGAARGAIGEGIGRTAVGHGGLALGGAIGKRLGGAKGELAGNILGGVAGSIGGGVGGYKALTHSLGKDKKSDEKDKHAGFEDLAEAAFPDIKVAEDSINKARITAGKAVDPDSRESGQPGGIQPKSPGLNLISTVEKAINFTRRDAKRESKNDSRAYWNEPALNGATDKTLALAFDHARQAGTKFASAEDGPGVKTAAARALLQKLAAAADEKKKSEQAATGL